MLERLSTPLESPKKYPTLTEAQNHRNSLLFQLEFNIDLPNQSIQAGNHSINFDIEDHRKERLLQGLDDIGITLGYKEDISSYESNKKTQKPWLFGDL